MVAKVNSMSDRQLSDLTLIGIGTVASSKEGRGLAIKAAINRRIAGIECNHALILSHQANPAGSDFRERQLRASPICRRSGLGNTGYSAFLRRNRHIRTGLCHGRLGFRGNGILRPRDKPPKWRRDGSRDCARTPPIGRFPRKTGKSPYQKEELP